MSRYDSRILKILAAGAALATAFFAFAPAAESQELDQGVEVATAASYASTSGDRDFELSSWAVRYHHELGRRWGLEGSFTHQDPDFIKSDLYELSARFTFFASDRVRVFALGGAGVFAYDFAIASGDGNIRFGSEEAAVFHLGLAAQVALGDRFYLRPDLRHRRALDLYSPLDNASSEASLAVGYRF